VANEPTHVWRRRVHGGKNGVCSAFQKETHGRVITFEAESADDREASRRGVGEMAKVLALVDVGNVNFDRRQFRAE